MSRIHSKAFPSLRNNLLRKDGNGIEHNRCILLRRCVFQAPHERLKIHCDCFYTVNTDNQRLEVAKLRKLTGLLFRSEIPTGVKIRYLFRINKFTQKYKLFSV